MQEKFPHNEEQKVNFEKKKLPENFEDASDIMIEKGNALMKKNHGPEGDEKIYHTLENHSGAPMQGRAKEIAAMLGLTPRQEKLVAMAISWHDTVIEYDKPPEDNITGMIKRHRGARDGEDGGSGPSMGSKGNEAVSAKLMLEEMERINKDAGKTIFTQEDMDIAQWAVDATFPKAEFGPDFKGVEFTSDPLYEEAAARNPAIARMIAYLGEHGVAKGPHFSQPHMEDPLLKEGKEIPLEVFTVAFADLGMSGFTKDPEEFFVEGDNECKESYHNLRKPENIKRLLNNDEAQDKEDRAKASQALLGWLSSQAGFAMWQMIRFEKVLYGMARNGQMTPEREQQARELLGNHEANIRASVDRAERARAEYNRILTEQGDKAAFANIAGKMQINI